MRAVAAPLAALALLATAATAAAHSSVVATSPAAGADLAAAPRAVTVTYSAPLGRPVSARVVVAGDDVAGASRLDPADRRRLVIPIAGAGPGPYRSSWVVAGADGHALSGETAFTVRPAPVVAAVRRMARDLRAAGARVSRLAVSRAARAGGAR